MKIWTDREELERALAESIPGFTDETIYSLRNIGTLPYYRVARDDMQKGHCPFCDLDEINVVLFENESWRAWENPVKKKGNGIKIHIVVAYRGDHITNAAHVNSYHWYHFGEVWKWFFQNIGGAGGGLVSRFGSPNLNAGTIRHFHHNLMVPDGTQQFRAPLVKKPEDFLKEDGPRLLVFEKLYRGAPVESLTEEEQALVKGRI